MNIQIPISYFYYIVGVIFFLILVISIAKGGKKKTKINMAKIDNMSGVEFEIYFTKILSDNGVLLDKTSLASIPLAIYEKRSELTPCWAIYDKA